VLFLFPILFLISLLVELGWLRLCGVLEALFEEAMTAMVRMTSELSLTLL